MKLTVESLGFAYTLGQPIFTDISLSVQQGEVLTILGSNGTGKSTLLNCIARQAKPSGGTITVDGRNANALSAAEFARYVAYVPQLHHPVFAYSVLDVVVMGRMAYLGAVGSPKDADYALALDMLSLMGVVHLAEKSYLEISGGERQLVLFAQALTQQPQFLILDEPTSHLDFGNQIRCLRIIQRMAQQGIGVLMSSHFPDHSLMFDHRVCILHEGRILAAGKSADVINPENMQRIYNIPVDISHQTALGRLACLPRGEGSV